MSLQGIWGKKIGMTQVFDENNKAIPVTVVDTSNWVVTRRKTIEQDGYNAIQFGSLKSKYADKDFKVEWIKKPNQYFNVFKEVKIEDPSATFEIGQSVDVGSLLQKDQKINAFGITKGRGFAGVVKRHNFAGGKASHGSNMGRRPGSIGFFTSQGKVVKGAKMPGHMGVDKRAAKGLKVVGVESDSNIVLISGSMPGNPGSFVYLQKV